jgi:hypothetical protein
MVERHNMKSCCLLRVGLSQRRQSCLPSGDASLPFFKDCRLARMSDGHYCLLRDLGPVKGAKGMMHHEAVIDFSRRGLLDSGD